MACVNRDQDADYFLSPVSYHTFVSDGHNYLFHADTLQVYEMNGEHFNEFIRINATAENIVETYLTRKEIKIIHDTIESQLAENPRATIITESSKDQINSLVLNITGDCNLRCVYCFASQNQGYSYHRMTPETARSAVDFMLKLTPDADRYSILFFGGEPLSNFRVMNETIAYSEECVVGKHGKRITFSIDTNGTLLTEPILELLKDKISGCLVSLDGPRHVHNLSRPYRNGRGSFDTIMKNIEILRDNSVRFMLRCGVRSDCSNIVELVDFFEGLQVVFAYEFVQKTKNKLHDSMEYTDERVHQLGAQLEELVKYYFLRISNGKDIYCAKLIARLSRIHFQQGKRIFCSSGRTTITVNPDGTIYYCQSLESVVAARVGDINAGIDYEKLNRLRPQNVDNVTECRRCWARYLCGGGCAAEKYVVPEDMVGHIEQRCALLRKEWECYLWLYEMLRNHCPEFLNNLESAQSV